MQTIDFKQQRDFNQVLNATFEFIKQEFKPLFKSVAMYAGPFILIYGILLGMSQASMQANTKNWLSANNPFAGFSYMFTIEYLIAIICMVISSIMIMTTIYSYVILYVSKGKGNFTQDELWDLVKNRFLSVLGTYILLMLILIPVGIVGIIALETPLIFLMVSWCFVLIITVYEQNGFGHAMSRSFYLVKDNWWFTFGILIVVYLIVSFASAIFMMPQAIVSMIYTFNAIASNGEGAPAILMIVLTTVGSFCASLLYSIIYITISFHYFSLVEKKENPSLFEKIQQINQENRTQL